MSEMLPPDAEQQLRRYFARQHRATPAPHQTWQGVAARLAALTEGSPPMNDTSPELHEGPRSAPTSAEQRRMRQSANPPRRGFVASAAALAAVILLALLARAVFSHTPAHGPSTTTPPQTVPQLVMSHLSDVSMVTANDGWAVGVASTLTTAQQRDNTTPPTVPLLFHYTGSAWQRISLPDALAGSELRTIAMHTSTDGWAGGGYDEDPPRYGGHADAPTNKLGVLLHYDGKGWQSVSVPETLNLTITQLVHDSTGDFWAMAISANYDGRVAILHEHAGTWTVAHSGTYGGFIDGGTISMVSASEGWASISYLPGAVNESGPNKAALLHLHNNRWDVAQTTTDLYITKLTMLSATDGWANVTLNGKNTPSETLMHYTNGTWQMVAPHGTDGAPIIAFATFLDATHGWFFGQHGTDTEATFGLYTFDGSGWSDAHVTPTMGIGAASFTSMSDGWFVGDGPTHQSLPDNGTISYGFVFAHYHDGTWTETKPSKDGK